MPERDLTQDTDILERLGINVPTGPPGGLGAQRAQPPMAEMSAPVDLAGIENLADTMTGGAILLLSQALSLYGPTSEKGDSIMRAINTLKKVVPPERMKEIERQVASAMGAIGMVSGAAQPPGPGATPGPPLGPQPGAGAPPSGVPGATPTGGIEELLAMAR